MGTDFLDVIGRQIPAIWTISPELFDRSAGLPETHQRWVAPHTWEVKPNNEKISANLLALKSALIAEDFGACAKFTKELLALDVSIHWDIESSVRVVWAEWKAGEPGSFWSRSSSRVGYSAYTKPSPSIKTGNHWSGGVSTSIDLPGSGNSISVAREVADRAAIALAKL